MRHSRARLFLSTPGLLLVTSFGLGLLRPAPGTWGSLPPVVLAGVMLLLADGRPCNLCCVTYHAVLIAVLVIFSLACVTFGRDAEGAFGKKDPGSVVADETAGQCFALTLLPASSLATTERALITLTLAFLAFRAFDILKLPPARGLQRLKFGWGILVDDLIAGVQAMVLVQVVLRVVMPRVFGW